MHARPVALFLLLLAAPPALAGDREAVILRTTGSRAALRQAVLAVGGTVDHEFQNAGAVAATVPAGVLAALGALPDVKVEKDALVAPPPGRDIAGQGRGVAPLGAPSAVRASALSSGSAGPADWLFNNKLIRANAVQATGNFGQGVVVAIIDTGTANNPDVVPALAGSIMGGQSMVPEADDPVRSPTSTLNGPHGTWVGSIVAGHALFGFESAGLVAQAIRAYAPDSVIDGAAYGTPELTYLPLVGVAPGARLYAFKVFSSIGGGSPGAWVLAALDRAITLKRNFLAGVPSVPVSGSGGEDDPYVFDSLDLGVVNMSLGGATLAAGRDLEDLLVQQLVDLGVTLAISAGNSGPSGLTTLSPSTSPAAIAAAAATTPAHERIFWSLISGDPAFGLAVRPSDTIQTAFFSARGPTADGRVGVSVSTAGDYNFVQGPDGVLDLVSGTSFAAPTVAGAAALLRRAVPSATAAQVRNAIIGSANPRVLGDNSTRYDQGAGFLDVEAAVRLLKGGKVSKAIQPANAGSDVAKNLSELGLRVRELEAGGTFQEDTGPLLPGERREYYLAVGDRVGALQLDVLRVAAALPPAQQNQVWGDDVAVQLQGAKTSAKDVLYRAFLTGPDSVTVTELETGVVRLTVLGDWTNAGRVGARVRVTALPKTDRPAFTSGGVISDGEWTAIPVTIPPGAATARFELSWTADWGAYPTNDVDLLVVDPDGNEHWDGATLDCPERTTIASPTPGTYMVYVNGYTVFGPIAEGREAGPRAAKTDRYKVRVYLE